MRQIPWLRYRHGLPFSNLQDNACITGKIIYIVAVDGRQTLSKGVTLEELAEIMLEIGCYNALNLDGGG